MDSGNSGSMQSSSGGEEEYDSRAETISAFLNNNPSSHVGPMPNPPPQPPPQPPPSQHHHHHHHHHHQHHQHHHSSSSMFDPLSIYFDNPLSSRSNPSSLLNLDMVWSKTLRSEPNCTDLGGFMGASSSSSSTQQLLTNQSLQSSRASFPVMHIPESVNTKASLSVSGSSSVSGLNIDQTNTIINNNSMVRNPKKRSRASRRAPTTVLTTDTTNFRAMVQEFTGIPAPPFTSSPFPRTRLDLFGTSSTLRSSSTHLDPSPPPYLLRPFAQKFHPPPFASPPSTSSSSSMIDAIASTTTNITSASTSNSNSTSINYQLPSDHLGFLKQHPQPQPQNLLNMNNMHNPILNLQSLLQPQPKYPLSNPTLLGTKPQGSLDTIHSNEESHLKIGVLEELGLSHGHLNTNLGGLQTLVSSDTTLPIRSESSNPTNWPGEHGTTTNDNDQGLFRSISGNYTTSQRVSNGKATTFSASSSDFLREKPQENVTTTRTEGMVESWICSSD